MISARLSLAGTETLLFGPVRGLEEEASQLLAALDAFGPEATGIGVSDEEMRGLVEYFVRAEAEPIVPLTDGERSEVRGLVRFGPVRVPNPSFVETLRWGQAHGVAVAPLDPDDERSASLFTEHIGYLELVRRTVAERRVGRAPPASSTADEFALTWDREVARGRGSRAFALARDRHFGRSAYALAADHARIALVVDRERASTVREVLAGGVPSERTGF